MQKIHGIPCFFKNQIVLDAIQDTFNQIKAKRPKDHARLSSLVLAIRPYKGKNDGTLGEWINGHEHESPGMLYLASWIDLAELPSIIAHELGHAATTYEDFSRRGCPESDEITSEVCADWYAYRWGFGRQIAKYRKKRIWMHHGPAPGSWIEFCIDGETMLRYQLTRNFCWRLVPTS